MPANFLHGVETIEKEIGARQIRAVKSAVIGLVGTAPIHTVDESYRTINKPVLILNDRDAVKYFGQPTPGYTIPSALKSIFEQGSGIVIVVNVFNPNIHKNTSNQPDVSKVTASDIIGGVDATGNRTGMQALKDSYTEFGFAPKIIIAPGFSTLNSVASAINTIASQLRAMGIIDAPIGASFQQVLQGRGSSGTINFNYSSDRLILCYPHVKVYNTATDQEELQPFSQFLAGVIAAKDTEKGYWFSPSNTEIKGIIGVERKLTAMINDPNSEVNLLNEAGIVTIFNNFGTGFRTWGNRSSAFPNNTHPKNFINIRRTADIIHESIEYNMLQFIDMPITKATIDAVEESVNSFIRTLISRGALIDGRCIFNPEKNQDTEIAAGHLVFDIEFMPPPPLERITFESFIDTAMLKKLI